MPDSARTPSTADFQLLCDVIATVARTSGLPPQDADDFCQQAHLRLVERQICPAGGVLWAQLAPDLPHGGGAATPAGLAERPVREVAPLVRG